MSEIGLALAVIFVALVALIGTTLPSYYGASQTYIFYVMLAAIAGMAAFMAFKESGA